MPIEFSCSQCQQLVRTPESAAGKKGKCPHCGAVMQIPGATTPRTPTPKTPPPKSPSASQSPARTPDTAAKWRGAPAASYGPPAELAPPVKAASDAPIEFPCPECQQLVRTPAAVAGKKGKCPHCQAVFQIPQVSQQGAQVAKAASKPQSASKPADPKPEKPLAAPSKPLTPSITPLDVLAPKTSQSPEPVKKNLSPALPNKSVPALTPLDQLAPLVKDSASLPAAGLKPLPSPALKPAERNEILPSSDPLDDLTPLDGLKPLDEEISPFHSGLTPLAPDALGANDDFYAAPLSSPAPFQRRSAGSGQMVVMLPAIFQMLSTLPTVVFILIQGIARLLALITMLQRELPSGAAGKEVEIAVLVGSLLGLLLWFGAVLFIIKGSIDLMKRQSYISAVFASLMSLLFCTCGVGFPFGLWALIVLCLEDVRRSFRS